MTSNQFIIQLIFSILAISFSPLVSQAQKFTVSGTVKEKSSSETLSGATIGIVEKPDVGVTTNAYDIYSLSIPKGYYALRFSYVERKPDLITIKLDSNITVSINMTEENSLQEVVISAKKENNNLTKAS